MSDRITESIGATEESGDEGSIDRKQVGIPSAEFRSPNDCNFDIVVINHTPIINPGDSIELDVYISGYGIPSKNQLYISYNRSLIDESEPGEVRTYVNLSPGKVKYSSNLPAFDVDVPTKMEQKNDIEIPGTAIGLQEGMFFPIHHERREDMFPVIVSQSNIYSHVPIEIRIESADCDSGDYQIPIILTYGTDEEISQAREDAVVHVNSKTEQYRWFIRVVGLIIALLTLIISAGIAEVLIVPALENLIS